MAAGAFMANVGASSLHNVRKVALFYRPSRSLQDSTHEKGEGQNTYSTIRVGVDKYLDPLCERIVASMPNIQKLEVYCPYALRIGSMIPTRNSGFEKVLLRFASLKKCTDILMDNLADDWIWGASETYESDNKLTAKAAKEMLLTGDHTALDRVRQS